MPNTKLMPNINLFMNLSIFKKTKSLLYSNKGLVVVVFVFLLLIGSSFFDLKILSSLNLNNDKAVIQISDEHNVGEESILSKPLIAQGPMLNFSEPVKLLIPKINVNSDFELPLDIEESGDVRVPNSYDKVGWYKYSPTPGELGPAVIFGHVDSKTGPAVFYSLGQLKTDDDIYVERADGSTAHFKVDFFERYEQKEFPTELVYGDIDHAGLRLVTCSGIYLRGQQRYTHNLVVYARLVD